MTLHETISPPTSAWYLVTRNGDMRLRVHAGMQVGEDCDGELSLQSADALIKLDIDEGRLVLRVTSAPESPGTPAVYVTSQTRARIRFPNNVFELTPDFEPAHAPGDLIDIQVIQTRHAKRPATQSVSPSGQSSTAPLLSTPRPEKTNEPGVKQRGRRAARTQSISGPLIGTATLVSAGLVALVYLTLQGRDARPGPAPAETTPSDIATARPPVGATVTARQFPKAAEPQLTASTPDAERQPGGAAAKTSADEPDARSADAVPVHPAPRLIEAEPPMRTDETQSSRGDATALPGTSTPDTQFEDSRGLTLDTTPPDTTTAQEHRAAHDVQTEIAVAQTASASIAPRTSEASRKADPAASRLTAVFPAPVRTDFTAGPEAEQADALEPTLDAAEFETADSRLTVASLNRIAAWEADAPAMPDLQVQPRDLQPPPGEADELPDLYAVSMLTAIRQDPPVYPRRAPRGANGSVDLEITLTPTGEVGDVQIHGQPPSYFSRSALRAVRSWKFEPIVVDGQPVPVRTRVKLTFRG